MKTEKLLNAIGNIDGNLIADAECYERSFHIINWHKFKVTAACLTLLFFAGITAHALFSNMTVGAFTMDVNPSVEYTVAKSGKVKNVQFLNKDAEKALHDVDLKKQDVEVAVERTVDAYEACGYMKKSNGTVLISFDSRINGNNKLKQALTSKIRNALEQSDSVESIIFHDESDNKSGEKQIEKIADEFDISHGKADFILAASNETGLAVDELSKLSLAELVTLPNDIEITTLHTNYIGMKAAKQIALKDAGCTDRVTFTDETLVAGGIKTPYYRLVFNDNQTQWTYHIDAVLGNILKKKVRNIGTIEFISLDKAKAIALKDAGLENVDMKIVFTKEELNRNQGKPCYLLEFYTAKYQYYYKIDAKNGKILESRRYILLSDAKKIAINDAGCRENVTFTDETLVDGGGGIKTPYYRLVFNDSQTQWSYRIDAVLGIILDKKVKDSNKTEFITLEKAKAIALKDAGLENVDMKIVFTKEELNRNQGKPCYLLEFYTGEYQYYYKIDAKNGKILDSRRYILLSAAKKIAVNDAGCTNRVTFTEETLVDGGGGIKTPYYRLVFNDSQTQWTYRIDAVLGIILDKKVKNIGVIEFITLDKAKAIALKDAGLENSDTKIVFTLAVLNRNQGKPCYLLEFNNSKLQYHYKIDAVTGYILEKGSTPISPFQPKIKLEQKQASEVKPDSSSESVSKQKDESDSSSFKQKEESDSPAKSGAERSGAA